MNNIKVYLTCLIIFIAHNVHTLMMDHETFVISSPIPTNLQAIIFEDRVLLTWDFEYDFPPLLGFRVMRDDINVTPVLVPPDTKSFHDVDLYVVGIYTYRVRALFKSPHGMTELSEPLIVNFVNEIDYVKPVNVMHLSANYPNPFNPFTSIRYQVSGIGNQNVEINVYNVRGQRVRTLLNEHREPGQHSVVWNGRDDSGREVGSGIYFYRMRVGEFTQTRSMVLLK